MGGPVCDGARSPEACDASIVRCPSCLLGILRAAAASVFFLGNLSYCLASLLLACLALQARAGAMAGEDREARRERVETCCSICSPWDGLAILHHLEHRSQATRHLHLTTNHLVVMKYFMVKRTMKHYEA